MNFNHKQTWGLDKNRNLSDESMFIKIAVKKVENLKKGST